MIGLKYHQIIHDQFVKWHPQLFKELEEEGQLQLHLNQSGQRISEYVEDLVSQGHRHLDAEHFALSELVYGPPESPELA